MATTGVSYVTDVSDEIGMSYRWEEWLKLYPLNRDTVLEYFANSRFYDSSSVNHEVGIMKRDGRPQSEIDALMKCVHLRPLRLLKMQACAVV